MARPFSRVLLTRQRHVALRLIHPHRGMPTLRDPCDTPNVNEGERVSELLRLAEADPRATIALATAATRQAHAERDLLAESVAERAIGIAAMHLADLDASVRHLRSAIRLADRAGSAEQAAEARIRLAFVLSIR